MSKKIIINKFGGGILTKNFIPLMLKQIREQIKNNHTPVIVISAFPGITDELLSLTKNMGGSIKQAEIALNKLKNKHLQIMKELGLDKNEQNKISPEIDLIFSNLKTDLLAIPSLGISDFLEDKIVSYGEKLSATVFTHYLNFVRLPAQKIFAEEIPILTDNNFRNANIIFEVSRKNILSKINYLKKEILVVPGFTGITKEGKTTTLGRGGTDTTACFIGSALKAEKIILWKNVDGVLSADPKIVKKVKTIPFISYLEAEESGKIIHDKAIQYVKLFKTPIEITSLSNPKIKTRVGEIKKIRKGAKIISSKENLSLLLINDEIIGINNLLSLISEAFIKNKVEIILISNTRYGIQIVADNNNGQLEKVYRELKSKVSEIEIIKASMIFLVGNFEAKDVNDFNDLLIKLKTDLQISAFFYENCNRMEAVIRTNQIEKVINVLHKKFIK